MGGNSLSSLSLPLSPPPFVLPLSLPLFFLILMAMNWQRLPYYVKKAFDTCVAAISDENNFEMHRRILDSVVPPCIPYLEIYFSDLALIEDGSACYLAFDDVIRFNKNREVKKVLSDIQQYQQCPYNLQVVESIRHYFFSQTQQSINEDDAFNLSLQLEPRIRHLPPPTSFPTLNQWEGDLSGQSNQGTTQIIRCYFITDDAKKKLNRVECHGMGYPFDKVGTKSLRKVVRQRNSKHPKLVAATLEKIVERMTAEHEPCTIPSPLSVSSLLSSLPLFLPPPLALSSPFSLSRSLLLYGERLTINMWLLFSQFPTS